MADDDNFVYNFVVETYTVARGRHGRDATHRARVRGYLWAFKLSLTLR